MGIMDIIVWLLILIETYYELYYGIWYIGTTIWLLTFIKYSNNSNFPKTAIVVMVDDLTEFHDTILVSSLVKVSLNQHTHQQT